MTARSGRWPDDVLAPCGTPAAARRHQRAGERPCIACREALSAELRTRRGYLDRNTPDPRPVRNNLPDTPPYAYRQRRYPWAEQALQRAEAMHGRPGNEAT